MIILIAVSDVICTNNTNNSNGVETNSMGRGNVNKNKKQSYSQKRSKRDGNRIIH